MARAALLAPRRAVAAVSERRSCRRATMTHVAPETSFDARPCGEDERRSRESHRRPETFGPAAIVALDRQPARARRRWRRTAAAIRPASSPTGPSARSWRLPSGRASSCAVEADRALGGLVDAGDGVEHRGLAGAVRADHREDLRPLSTSQIDARTRPSARRSARVSFSTSSKGAGLHGGSRRTLFVVQLGAARATTARALRDGTASSAPSASPKISQRQFEKLRSTFDAAVAACSGSAE